MAGRVRNFIDGLANLASGAGTTADKRAHAFYTRPWIDRQQIEAAYRSSWLLRKGIDLPPFDMTRNGRDWQLDGADVSLVEAEEKRLCLWTKLRQALVLGRLGGGLIVMGIGNEDPTTPIGTAARAKGSLRYLHVMNRWQVSLGPIVRDPADDLFGQPAYFQITFGEGRAQGQVQVHPSRIVAFRGRQSPNLAGSAGDEWFWGDPLMLTVADAVKNADAAMNGFASLVEEAKLDTVGIPGLTQLCTTAEGEAAVLKRVTIANQIKSTHNTRIIDGGKPGVAGSAETWDTRQLSWAGMPDMIRVYAAAVAGAFDIPATRFLGKSPDGMNATGTGDEANYIAKIRADQNADLRPALDQIDAILLPSAGVTMSAEAWYDFPPLQEMSELDEATSFMNRMTAITALQNTGAIPAVAFDKALQNEAVERQWMAGLDGALAEVPDDERFPSENAPDPAEGDPSAIQSPDPISNGKEGDPNLAPGGVGSVARRRAANDALKAVGLSDADCEVILDAAMRDYNHNHSQQNGEFTSGGGDRAQALKKIASEGKHTKPAEVAAELHRQGFVEAKASHPDVQEAAKASFKASRSPQQLSETAERTAAAHSERSKAFQAQREAHAASVKSAEMEIPKAPILSHFSEDEKSAILRNLKDPEHADELGRLATVGAITKAAQAEGWTLRHTSREGRRASSRYLVHPNGNEVRVSDHFVPDTPKREAGYRGKWAGEIVVGREWRTQSLGDYLGEINHIATHSDDD